MPGAADEAVEEVVRTSYGRLVALLASRGGDLAAAEDAMSEALLAALRTWPVNGVPRSPEAWMLTAARRSMIGVHRRDQTAQRAAHDVVQLAEELRDRAPSTFPDRRLELLFACAHPAVAADVRAPLVVQVVLGVDAARIASAFRVRPTTLGQQLVRAKRRIASTGVPYRVPGRDELPERLGAVLDAVYVAYGAGWDDPSGVDPRRADLTGEAVHLAAAIVELMPDQAEGRGLLALLLHTEARAAARRDEEGRFVPLERQDTGLWSRSMLERAEGHLSAALAAGPIGPYQLLAAIQSVHNRRCVTGETDWATIARLHDGLAVLAPSVGGATARAAAHLRAAGPVAARRALAELGDEEVEDYQPYWVTRAEIAATEGRSDEARHSWVRAIELTTDVDVADHLRARLARASDPAPS